MTTSPNDIFLDLVIIGGGVAGLWLANRAQQQGYSIAVLESHTLGGGQTLASQGMIHGGMKYTLAGTLTGASEAIADMPRHWRACLCGEGDVDLRNTRILSDHFYMWSGNTATGKLTSFLASKVTRGRVTPLTSEKYPPLLRHPDFAGSLYKLDDVVIDTPSLVANLAAPLQGTLFTIDWAQARLETENNNVVLTCRAGANAVRLHAQTFIFTAGKGNEALVDAINSAEPAQQLRPLKQVMVKHHHPFDFYGHCLGLETTPRLTISSHPQPDGSHIWYLGGSLAERGATMDDDALIALAEKELRDLIPWIYLDNAEWACLSIDRAEPRQRGFARPDNAFITAIPQRNALVGWPTKLTLAPNFANMALDILAKQAITPRYAYHAAHPLKDIFPPASLGVPPWQIAFPPALSPEALLEKKFAAIEDDNE